MGRCIIRGSSGIEFIPVDDGTLCRTASLPSGPTGSVTLDLDATLVGDVYRSALQNNVYEGLRRGATDLDLWILCSRYHVLRKRLSGMNGKSLNPFSDFQDSIENDWVESVVEGEKKAFDAILDSEMARLTAITAVENGIKDKADYQYRVRPLYYTRGYTDPIKFLGKVVEYIFLGHNVLIHGDLVAKLKAAPDTLNGWTTGLADSTGREFKSATGLQIRLIAGSDVLSNHAFGLAIDFDAYSNPHVVGREVVEVFNWVAKQGGVAYDFGATVLPQRERGHASYSVDDVMELYHRAMRPSNVVRAWLQTYLPEYRKLMAVVRDGEKELGVPQPRRGQPGPIASSSALADHWSETSAADANAQKSGKQNPATLERVTSTILRISSDENLRRVQTLHERFADVKYIDTWVKQGVLTVPFYLACVLAGSLGLRWGEQYENSKDAMHFELMGPGDKDYIQAENPLGRKEASRSLKKLMDTAFVQGTQLKLTKSAFLSSGPTKK